MDLAAKFGGAMVDGYKISSMAGWRASGGRGGWAARRWIGTRHDDREKLGGGVA
jgi:hypothetical protein